MKKLLLLLGFMFIHLATYSQIIYVADNQGFSDFNVYVTTNQGIADLLVYKQPVQGFVGPNNGQWFFTTNFGIAKKRIFYVGNQGFADLIIFYVNSQAFAGWKNPKKKYLLE